jgi:hypothetical protein
MGPSTFLSRQLENSLCALENIQKASRLKTTVGPTVTWWLLPELNTTTSLALGAAASKAVESKLSFTSFLSSYLAANPRISISFFSLPFP